ncbi:IS4 family transposase [Streptomyces sp. H10-C2]|uniref:IS4 family transposase n=1 Tax=unclassified Streptomyces TaxID=2593676 RepID=UPI0024B98AA0|nr:MULTISPECIES: IS4 family transposase [unclassified Streptomyces]MDJ0347655.1 IS4 family transposase [Streptomyces sp. PH10-H1]MDJ0375825.1 IS4 family transposase [Streptomyces sp. H10-C2]
MVQFVTGGTDVFAPGHIGELTQVIPPELVDAVLEETGARERRLRSLPSRVGVYFVLTLGLFEYLGAELVWGKLVAGLTVTVPRPSEKALRDLRRRVGVAPFKRLFEVLAGPLAQPSTPGVCYRRWRTVAFDGCGSLNVPDHERNRSWLGRTHRHHGPTGYPRLMLMTLCETGTRGLIAAVFGSASKGETDYAHDLVGHLTTDMLLLADRAFDSNELLADIAAQGAQFLIRATSTRRPPVLALLPDGSYLTRIGTLRLRVIEGEIHARTAHGGDFGGTYRLLTTLSDHRTDPAAHLVRLYHERWEIEITYLALRHTLLKGRVLRSKDPVGLQQEMWALLTLYQALRSVIVTAVETVPGCDPDRAGFTVAVEAARDAVVSPVAAALPSQSNSHRDLVGHIGTLVLHTLLPSRRSRLSARVVKCGTSRYNIWNRDGRPRESTPITAIEITVHPPVLPGVHDPGQTPSGRWGQVCKILAANANQAMHMRDIAQHLGLATTGNRLKGFTAQLCYWARNGRLIRTAPNTYKITLPDSLTSPTGP